MKIRLLLAFFFIVIANVNVEAQEIPPFANITSVEYRGTGCDAESARVVMTPDLSYLSVLYDRFSVEVGTGTMNPTVNVERKNCVIIVKFDLPAGWSLQFDEVEYRGFVSLANANSMAHQMISVETMAGKGRNFQENIMQGPRMGNFVTVYKNSVINGVGSEKLQKINQRPDRPGRPERVRSGDLFDCSDRTQQGVLRIRSRIAVKNAGDSSNSLVKMVVDSTDASFNQKLKINWNRCASEPPQPPSPPLFDENGICPAGTPLGVCPINRRYCNIVNEDGDTGVRGIQFLDGDSGDWSRCRRDRSNNGD